MVALLTVFALPHNHGEILGKTHAIVCVPATKVAHYFTWYMGMCDHHVRSLAFINLFHGFSSSALGDECGTCWQIVSPLHFSVQIRSITIVKLGPDFFNKQK